MNEPMSFRQRRQSPAVKQMLNARIIPRKTAKIMNSAPVMIPQETEISPLIEYAKDRKAPEEDSRLELVSGKLPAMQLHFMPERTSLDSLPSELILEVAKYLTSTRALCTIASTNRRFYDALKYYRYKVHVTLICESRGSLLWAAATNQIDVASRAIKKNKKRMGIDASYTALHHTDFIFPFMVHVCSRREGPCDKQGVVRQVFAQPITALRLAVLMGHLEMARFLIERGADPNQLNGPVRPLTFVPIRRRFGGRLKLLMQPGLLAVAAEQNKTELVRYLLPFIDDPDEPTRGTASPSALAMAVRNSNYDMVKLLLAHPSVDPYLDRGGFTPLSLARRIGDERIIRLFQLDARRRRLCMRRLARTSRDEDTVEWSLVF